MLSLPVFGQIEPVERNDLNIDQDLYLEVASELRCPTCTGLSILDSDAAFSVQIKNQVKEQLAAGKSEKEILGFFVERYGPWILRSPPVQGVNSLAWFLPIGAMFLGPLLIWFFLGRKSSVVVASAFEKVRSSEVIIAEMQARINSLKAAVGHE
jgi:cytochrome c-type biogenesis protein CcmH/NrfF